MLKMSKPFAISVRMMIQDTSGNYLLVRRSINNKSNVGKWEFPGGKIEPGEEFYNALLREIKEETGLTVNVEHIVGVTESETSTLRIATLIFEGTKQAGQICISEEHDTYTWVKPQELSTYDLISHLKNFVIEYICKKL
jgi:8-oxo-dGTP diphosphatase